jgi:DNA polymerase III epsilon subunit-like protein
LKGDEKLNLTACSERAKIKLSDAHGAMNDVEATADLLRYFTKRLRSSKSESSVLESSNRERGQKFFEFACGAK